jgi:hypothetical protein
MKEAFVLFKNMKSGTGHVLFWCIAPLIIGFPMPSLAIFYLEVFVAHTSSADAATDILHRQFAEGDNLFLGQLMGLPPFAGLSLACFLAAHKFSPARLACLGIFGLLGILAFMIPCHISVWYPHYSGGHMSSTAVIAFVFIPFFCFVPLVIGLLIGWCISLLPCFRPEIPE